MLQGLPVNLDGPKERDPGWIVPPTPKKTAPKPIQRAAAMMPRRVRRSDFMSFT